MITRTQIVALSDDQLVQALQVAASIVSAANTYMHKGTLAMRAARKREALEANAAIQTIRDEMKLRHYKASVGGALLTERKPGWCWGDARPAINRTSKKGGGVWMPVR